jgi:hypothetical protein
LLRQFFHLTTFILPPVTESSSIFSMATTYSKHVNCKYSTATSVKLFASSDVSHKRAINALYANKLQFNPFMQTRYIYII